MTLLEKLYRENESLVEGEKKERSLSEGRDRGVSER